ncbi:elongin A, like [Labrus mixtus]|uniref:elongin A, like n=1 Tax=Labrus mixtus TaxID=508554 RepID=UPI0029C09713|nr:elongin A, like [Labrus mixtus]
MASSSDVVKKVMRFKLQLSDPAESATVVKILQKLKDLEITLDILAETGIGKTVNSLRRHEQAGEIAKSLVRGWKRLVPKDSTSQTEAGEASESLSAKEKPDDHQCENNNSSVVEDLNNNRLTSHSKSHDSSSGEDVCKKSYRKADAEKRCEEQKTLKDQRESREKGQKENKSMSPNEVCEEKVEFEEDKMDNSGVSKKKKTEQRDSKSRGGDTLSANKSSEDTRHKSRSHSKDKRKRSSESGRFESEKEAKKKCKTPDPSPKGRKDSFSFDSEDNFSKPSQPADVKGISRDSEDKHRKRKRKSKEKHTTREAEDAAHKNKKAKLKQGGEEKDPEEPSMSFESCLNYDVNVRKRKEKSAVKKRPKKFEEEVNVDSPKQKFKNSIMDLINIPLPAVLPEYEKPSCDEYFERRVEKEPDFCDDDYAVFTGQRLNKKMQVYSGNKTVFLPTMMSLHQQCVRTLQNNINLLYETGGVPFEILQPVLERCTPEQLLRIEECNPIYVGQTDDLWGKHCQRDFKDSKLLEYESWKEMYIRLSAERERKLQRLTKSIVSAHQTKPKGRQVKMAFIHTVAKPPRDVRIQQEIHGTAVQQPQPPKSSVKVQDVRPRTSCDEPSRPSSTSSGSGNTQDPRKKTRVAPMMAKSLKAFKKQLGRR